MLHLLIIIYLSFISLGLPDGLLGAAWPSIYGELGVDISLAGGISIIISGGTILSSLLSDRLTHRFGAGLVTAFSVVTTAIALLGFSLSGSYWMLCLWAIPYGLGAGSVDAALNNYVALHYSSRHMSWLHCMWGIGASAGPYLMGAILTRGVHWTAGYRYMGLAQLILSALILSSLKLWRSSKQSDTPSKPIPLRQAIRIPGATSLMLSFFCYCALEQTAALWAGTFLTLRADFSAENAASFACLFFLGMTLGRLLSGFLAPKFQDKSLILSGSGLIALGIIFLIPAERWLSLIGLFLLGLGCAPIYPSIIHSIPQLFGEHRSQAIIGIQMASAYMGTALMPPIFGLIATHLSIGLMSLYLAMLLIIMLIAYQRTLSKCTQYFE